jgi:hypothetical protein
MLGEDFVLKESQELQQFSPSYIQPMNLEIFINLDDYSQSIIPSHPPQHVVVNITKTIDFTTPTRSKQVINVTIRITHGKHMC